MSGSRDRVLRDIRGALNRTAPVPPSVARVLDARLRRPTANLKPAFSGDLVERFVEKVLAVNGTVARVAGYDEVSAEVSRHLAAHGLPPEIVVAPDPALDEVRWSNRLRIERRAATGDDHASVTGAFAGVAETGTLVLLSGPESPTTLNFLPDDHLVVLRESRVVKHLEDAWARLRKERKSIPRTINLITGPSKTGDIEQKIHEGAHGPRRFHVILVAG